MYKKIIFYGKRGYGKLQTAFMLQTMPLSAISRWHYSLVYWLP